MNAVAVIQPRWRRVLHQAEPWIVAAALSAGAFDRGFDDAAGRAAVMLISGSVLALLLITRPPDIRWWRAIAPVLGLLALAYSWLLVGGWVAPQARLAPDLAEPYLLCAAAGLCAFLAGTLCGWVRNDIAGILDRWAVLVCCSILLGAAAAFGIAQGIDVDGIRRGRFVGLIDNANLLADIAGSLVLIALVRVLPRRQARGRHGAWALSPARLFFAALAAIGAVALVGTGSRFPALLTLLLVLALTVRATLRAQRRIYAGIAIVLLAAIGLVFAGGFSDLLFERFGDLANGSYGRAEMWTRYMAAAERSPLFGYGAGSFPTLNAMVLEDPGFAQSAWTVNSPHNVLLQILLEGGIPFLLLHTAAVFVVGQRILRWCRRTGLSSDAWGVLAVLALIAGSAMIDIALDSPTTTGLFLFLIGLLWGEALAAAVVGVAQPESPPAQKHVAVGGRLARQ